MDEDKSILRPQFGEVWIVFFGATCQQGSACIPKTPVARCIGVIGFISLMFLFTSYSACITVLLQSTSTKIKTLQHLYDSGFTMALHNNSWNDPYFAVRDYWQHFKNKIINSTIRLEQIHSDVAFMKAKLKIEMEQKTYLMISKE